MFMRELIYKDIYLIRKNLLITLGIFVGFFFIGLIVALSAKFGNLAKYVTDSEMLGDLKKVSLYLSIIAGLMLVSGEEHIFGIIHKEYESTYWKKKVAYYEVLTIQYISSTYQMYILKYIITKYAWYTCNKHEDAVYDN